MLKWTTYDGTFATLPPEACAFLLHDASGVRCAKRYIGSPEVDIAWDHCSRKILVRGDAWALFPTPAECAAWEALREAAGKLADALPQNSTGAVMLREALAALEAAEKEINHDR